MRQPEELFRHYYKDVYGYLYSLCRDSTLAEDLTGEVFLEVVTAVRGFRGEADVKTWLFSIARHRWLGWLRKQKRQVETEALSELLPDKGLSPDARQLERERLERIRSLLEQEPERTRAIVLKRLEGYSFYEIGRQHGISESSARVIWFRARNRLREQLTKEGFLDE